jgi:hypothetical protein
MEAKGFEPDMKPFAERGVQIPCALSSAARVSGAVHTIPSTLCHVVCHPGYPHLSPLPSSRVCVYHRQVSERRSPYGGESVMTFYEVVRQVLDLLQRQRRVSYRALKREFSIDDDFIEDLKEELLYAHESSVQADDRGFTWTGETGPPESDVQREIDGESWLHELILTVIGLLQCERRVTYRRLKHILGLDGALLEEIREELTLRRLAIGRTG